MAGQPEITNFLRSLKPFVNQEGITILEVMENFLDLMSDPKMKAFTGNVQTLMAMMKQKSSKN